MAEPLLLAVDQGTTGTTALLVGLDGTIHRRAYREVPVTIRYTSATLAKGQSSWNAVRIAWQFLIGKVVK